MWTDADRKLAQVAARHHGVFTVDDAVAAGLTHGQIDRRAAGVWLREFDGVYRMPGVAATWQTRLVAACRAAAPPAAASRRSGAAVYELPGGRPDLAEIVCRRWQRSRHGGVIVHESTRLDERDITEVNGIVVVTAERLILELAGARPDPNYVEMVIHAARRKRLITYESTFDTFDRLARRGVPGVKAMRIALERWDPADRVTHSEMEVLLVQKLRAHGLPKPVTQFRIHDEFGNVVAEVDAAYPQWKIAIEYDSKQEHSDEFQLQRDARRRNDILAAGYAVFSVRHEELRSGGSRLAEQVRTVARRSA